MQHLSHPDLALLLGDLYHRAGLGLTPGEEHRALADYLGCHPDVQAAVWEIQAIHPGLIEQDLGRSGD